ncbi:MAG: hypothetical protein PHT91_01965 [Candidatus Nanoarchaeia archaeon]|nr:hypothetical protein [Candidatus Nanoarchaeia archaeon]
MKEYKPKKRVMLYWFIKYGFFFLFASFLMTATFLRFNTFYFSLMNFFLNMSIIILLFSVLFLPYKWKTTNYFLLKKHLYIKEADCSSRISYKEIKKVGQCETLFEKLLGITNIYIETINSKNYYLSGIRNNAVATELISHISSN